MSQFNSNYYENNSLTFRSYLSKVFSIMALGVGISTIVTLLVSLNIVSIFNFLGNASFGFVLGVCIAELVVAFYFSSRLASMSKGTAWGCYIVYCILTGLSLSTIVIVYSSESVLFAFLSTTILFICMAVIGHTTHLDLSKFSTIIFAGLLSLMITSLLNALLFRSAAVNYFMSFIGVLLFLFIIAYDVQRLREYYNEGSFSQEFSEKMMIMGAFQLYLDFINLFIRILQIFGRSSNSRD